MDALVVIDVQQGLFSIPDYPPHDGDGLLARIAALEDRARQAGTPIQFVQHASGAGDVLEPGTPGFAFHDRIAPRAGEAVTVKRRPSAFHNTDLDETLRRAGIDHLIVCGMQSDMCVDSTVRAASALGYRITLVSDGHSTMDNGVLPAETIVAHHNRALSEFAALKKARDIAFAPRADEASVAIDYAETDDAITRRTASDGILAFNAALMGPHHIRSLRFTLRRGGQVIGGLVGRTAYSRLFVELLFVPEELRGRGMGERLLAMAEEEALRRGCTSAWLDTFNPAAKAFYEKRGYRVFGTMTDYPNGHARHFMEKRFATG